MSSNGWNEQEKLVLSELKRLSSAQERMSIELIDIRLILEGTKFWGKVMSGILGGVMGVLAVVASEVVRFYLIKGD